MIVAESAGNVVMIVPSLLAAVVAIGIGNLISESCYVAVINIAKLPYLTKFLPAGDIQEARDLMVPLEFSDDPDKPTPILPRITNAGHIARLLETPFVHFDKHVAVVDNSSDKILIGYVSRFLLQRALDKLKDGLIAREHSTHSIDKHHPPREPPSAQELSAIKVDLTALPGLTVVAVVCQVDPGTPATSALHIMTNLHAHFCFVSQFGRLQGVITARTLTPAHRQAPKAK